MKNKKGFTLVELLAVIVILGVLLLVAVPAVSRVITNSRMGADRDEAIEYLNAISNCTLANGNTSVCSPSESKEYLNSTAISGYYDTSACPAEANPSCTYITDDTIYLKDFAFKGTNGYVVYVSGKASVNQLKDAINKANNTYSGTAPSAASFTDVKAAKEITVS